MKKEINMFYFFQDMDSVVYEMLYEVGLVRNEREQFKQLLPKGYYK